MNNFHLKDQAFEQVVKSKFKTFENEFQATCEMQYNDAGSIIVMPVCKSEDGIGILMTVQKEAIEVDEDQQFRFKITNEQVEEELNDKYDHFYDLLQASCMQQYNNASDCVFTNVDTLRADGLQSLVSIPKTMIEKVPLLYDVNDEGWHKLDDQYCYNELESTIVNRGQIFVKLLDFFNYQPAQTFDDFDRNNFERVCYDLNMHRLYGFGGCNIDPWLQFYKDNMREVCQYLLTLPQDELDAFEQMIDDAFEDVGVSELLKVIVNEEETLLVDFIELLTMFTLDQIGDIFDQIVPEV